MESNGAERITRFQDSWMGLVARLVLLTSTTYLAPAQSNYQVVPIASPGTIKGTVKWQGARPKPLTLPITKNWDVCDPQSQKKRDLERLVVGPDGGVANTVVFLKNISQGKAMDLPEIRRFVNQKTCRYEPHILLVPQDVELLMKSSDPILHNLHMTGAASYNLPFPIKDQVITRPVHQLGVVNLSCNAGHVWMNGEILVVYHPYYAVTDETGGFLLTDVPPGEYEIEAWHEGWHVAREETAFDVSTQQKVRRPLFTEPLTWQTAVTVLPNATAVVNFEIPETNVRVLDAER